RRAGRPQKRRTCPSSDRRRPGPPVWGLRLPVQLFRLPGPEVPAKDGHPTRTLPAAAQAATAGGGSVPGIRVSVSVRPDEETFVPGHVYPDRPPIMVISAERHTFTIGCAAPATSTEMVGFANLLVAAAHRYLDAVSAWGGDYPPEAPRMFPHHPTRWPLA